ncbi:Uncharacterized protein APZ42_000864 [Daphnia magna]|uniref:Uncharacterized protein n=1 Tax=Daphnia magna TaxID=35525 RepID=A0A164JBU4_9CRUS|nr:Uncharacterized protein APZ42_000864 [Daphnia magna]
MFRLSLLMVPPTFALHRESFICSRRVDCGAQRCFTKNITGIVWTELWLEKK